MSDEIIGLSVLQPTWIPNIYRMWFRGRKGSGETSQGWIFAVESGKEGIPAKFPDYPDGCNAIWRFTRRGNWLDCTPSVNWVSWGFHNSGSWSTEYVEMTNAERTESKAGPEPTRYEVGHTVHYELNLARDNNLQELLEELHASKVLL